MSRAQELVIAARGFVYAGPGSLRKAIKAIEELGAYCESLEKDAGRLREAMQAVWDSSSQSWIRKIAREVLAIDASQGAQAGEATKD